MSSSYYMLHEPLESIVVTDSSATQTKNDDSTENSTERDSNEQICNDLETCFLDDDFDEAHNEVSILEESTFDDDDYLDEDEAYEYEEEF